MKEVPQNFNVILDTIPYEIWVNHISVFLEPIDLSRLMKVCKRFKEEVSYDYHWKRLSLRYFGCFPNFDDSPPSLKVYQLLATAQPILLNDHLEVTFSDGGDYSSEYTTKNLLSLYGHAYCTDQKNANVNVIIKSSFPFILSSFIVSSPGTFYSAPISSGLFFVSPDEPDIKATEVYNDLKTPPVVSPFPPRDPNKPVASFFGIDRTQAKGDFPKGCYGQYILLKMLSSGGNSTNIDIDKVEFYGTVFTPGNLPPIVKVNQNPIAPRKFVLKAKRSMRLD